MRSKCRVTAIALGLSAVGVAVGALFLFSDQTAGTRSARLNATASQIRAGNYYAWAQTWMWLEKMTPDEKNLLLDCCAQYARTNRSLQVKDCCWPPEKCTPGMQPVADWMRNVAGYRTTALVYDDLAIPPMPQIEVAKFEHMFFSRRYVAP